MTAIRLAGAADLPAVRAVIDRAFVVYVERLGCLPAPMEADHEAHIGRGEVFVAVEDDEVLAAEIPTPDAVADIDIDADIPVGDED